MGNTRAVTEEERAAAPVQWRRSAEGVAVCGKEVVAVKKFSWRGRAQSGR